MNKTKGGFKKAAFLSHFLAVKSNHFTAQFIDPCRFPARFRKEEEHCLFPF